MYDENIPVLIVGGGPTGLTLLLFLARLGIPSCLVERHPSTSSLPRARGINIRTMEVLRSAGMEEALYAAGPALTNNRYTLSVDTLAGKELHRVLPQGPTSYYEWASQQSPTTWCLCTQDELEPLLATAACNHGGDIRFGRELLSFEQDAAGVTAQVVERTTGISRMVRSNYLVAADGANSPVRSTLRVQRTGRGTMAHYINIHFRADLSELVRNRPFVMCFVDHPEARGIFFTINDTDRWLFTVPYAPEREKAPADFTPAHCKDLVRKAVGLPHMPVDILSAHPWEAASLVADRFQIGQIFLAGDAAHVMPPFGAFGINTGVQDAHNLAWKLAMVLKGQAGSSLLSTYDAERRPVGQFTTKHSEDRLEGMLSRTVSDLLQEGGLSHIQQQLIAMLGYQYVSDAVIPEHDEAAPTDRLALSGQPGTRAPHLWVQHGSRRISMLDLFDRHFVLLTGENGQPWREAMHTLARHLGLDLDAYCVGTASDLIDLDRKWSPSYGVGRDGAVLVRPDGFVAWRIKEPNCTPYSTLARVLGQLLCRFPG